MIGGLGLAMAIQTPQPVLNIQSLCTDAHPCPAPPTNPGWTEAYFSPLGLALLATGAVLLISGHPILGLAVAAAPSLIGGFVL